MKVCVSVCVYLHVCRCRLNELQPSAVARFSSCSKDSPCLITPHSNSPRLALPRNIFSFCSFQFAVFSLSCRFVFDTFGKLLPGCAKVARGERERKRRGAARRVELSAATSNIVAVAVVVVVGAIRKSYKIYKASVISYLKCH